MRASKGSVNTAIVAPPCGSQASAASPAIAPCSGVPDPSWRRLRHSPASSGKGVGKHAPRRQGARQTDAAARRVVLQVKVLARLGLSSLAASCQTEPSVSALSIIPPAAPPCAGHRTRAVEQVCALSAIYAELGIEAASLGQGAFA